MELGDLRCFFERGRPVPGMGYGGPPQAGPSQAAGASDGLQSAAVLALEPAVVDLLGDKGSDVGVHSEGAVEEEAAVGRDCGRASQGVLEGRSLGSVGMRAFRSSRLG